MLNFLKSTRKLLNLSEATWCMVIGNESCDLDSAVCALSLALFYHHCPAASATKHTNFLPVMNVLRADFPLKTEVTYFLRKHGIDEELLTFRDDIVRPSLAASECILVDHHVSPLASRCIQVFDHRPYDEACNLPKNCQLTLELVGSCATLISDLILQHDDHDDETHPLRKFSCTLEMLYATIVMDTVNFSSDAGRATPRDHEVAARIEQHLNIDDVDAAARLRAQIFRELCAAREDLTGLTTYQLLFKDMKMVTNDDDSRRIAMPGNAITVQEFIARPDAAEAIEEFAKATRSAVVVLLGMRVSNERTSVQRDLGVINVSDPQLFAEVLQRLLTSNEPTLDLEELPCDFLHGKFYQQKNVKMTRKHILPIVKNVLQKTPQQ